MPAPRYQEANPIRAGRYEGFHPEDQPFMSGDLEVEDDDSYYVTRQPTSVRRYNAPVSRRGDSYAVHYGPPPVPRRTSQYPVVQARRRYHWLTYVGVLMIVALVGWLVLTMLGAWWQSKQDDWTYGNPRTYQTDAVVGHGDSTSNPSHFIAENLRGQIVVVEYPGGDVSKARSYSITTLPGNDSYPPVTVKFQNVNQDSKPDMVINIGDPGTVLQIVLFNNGSQFVAKL